MRRTLQTALASLDWLLAADVPFQAHAGWQETTDHTCDVGSPVEALKQDFPEIDFSQVDPIFPDKTSERAQFYAYNRRALVARAQHVLAELHARPESVVLVVSHSAFLSKAVTGSMFGNADFRIFSFEDAEAPTAVGPPAEPATTEAQPTDTATDLPPLVYRLREWEETRKTHGGMGWSYDMIRKIGEELPI